MALPNSLVSIAVARSVVRRVTTFASDDAQSSFLIALTEVVGNAVDEHVRLGSVDPVTMTVSYDDSDTVSVSDCGQGYDAEPASVVPSNPSQESGRGLAIARSMVPEMAIESTGSGTTVTLPLVGLGIVR